MKQINFSQIVKPKVINFVRNQLKIVLKQGNNVSPELIVNEFQTIWRGLHSHSEQMKFPKKFRFTLRRDKPIKLESKSDFVLQAGIVDAYLYTQNGERLGIHRGGNRLDCSNVPPGEYNLLIKTEYEPSNEGEARFLDRVKIV